MNISIRDWSIWHVTALDIQVSLRNLMAMLEDSMTSIKTLEIPAYLHPCYKNYAMISLSIMKLSYIIIYIPCLNSDTITVNSAF